MRFTDFELNVFVIPVDTSLCNLHLINWGVLRVSTFCAVLALGTWKLLTS